MSENNCDILRTYTISKKGIEKTQGILESLGFKFESYRSKRYENLTKATLPDNYTGSLVSADNSYCVIDFYDENKIKRGNFYINKNNHMCSTVVLRKRISIHAVKHGYMQEYYIGTPELKLISFGAVNTEIGSSLYIESRTAELQQKLREAANEIYPDWENPLAYWELTDEELVSMLLPKIERFGGARIRTNPNFSTLNPNE